MVFSALTASCEVRPASRLAPNFFSVAFMYAPNMDRVDEFLAYCATQQPNRYSGEHYYDQMFCRYFRKEYEWAEERLQNDDGLTRFELVLLMELLWQDERLPTFNDWTLARDHEAPFVYELAARLLRDRLSSGG